MTHLSVFPLKIYTLCYKSQQSQQGWRSQQQASSQRTAYQGLEMKSELVWEDWEPEKEFTKTLVLKNIHSELQKLTVRSCKHL